MKQTLTTLLLIGCLWGVLAQPLQAQVGRGAFGFGVSAIGNSLQSDWKTNELGPGASADISYSLGSGWGLLSRIGFDEYRGINTLNQTVRSTSFRGDLSLSLDVLPSSPVNPFIFAGAGIVFYYPRVIGGAVLATGNSQPWDMAANGGIGLDFYINPSWSMILSAEGTMMLNDQLDGYKAGNQNDIIGRVSVGIRYYLFDRSAVERIVKAVQQRF